ncbi:MAG: hypothetical protein GC162_00545 [Planctomycetes bacterium]|nr:hypothetical protein [Planctomycetota bacterium]
MYSRQHMFGFGVVVLAACLSVGVVTMTLAEGSGSKSGSGSKAESQKTHVTAELNAQALKALMGARVPMVVLDARGPSDQWIPGAIPLAYDAKEPAIRRLLTDPNQLVVTYCGGPECPMSLMLADHLAELGHPNVIRFTGGINAWTQAGLPLQNKNSGSASKSRPSGSGTR